MASRIKQEAAAHPIPQSREEAVEAIRQIGDHQRDRQRIKADLDDEIAKLRETADKALLPHNTAISELSAGVKVWAEANRESLTNGGRSKTVELMTGKVLWRLRPPRVAVRSIDAVIDLCKRLGLDRFVRTREELNKEAMLAEKDVASQVKGISISQGEDFVIQPFETELEEVA